MRRIRVTGRFYVFLAMLAIGLFFIAREFFSFGDTVALVTTGTSNFTSTYDAVIVRDESVASYEGNGRVVYLASEGQTVSQGQDVVELYTVGYATKAFEELEKVRKDIRAYYQSIAENIIDSNLERLEQNVQAQALEIKKMVQNRSIGNLGNVERALEQTMKERQAYLNQNRREDSKLNAYYNSEASKLTAINSYKVLKKADKPGLVSFYLDGYERQLTFDKLPELTAANYKDVIQGRSIATGAATSFARMTKDVFKVVTTDKWYVILISSDAAWSPINGQTYGMQLEGVSGYAFVGTVKEVQKSDGETIAQIEVNQDIGPLLNRRSGKMDISVNLSGFSVPIKALSTYNGQKCVWLDDAAGGTPVPVNVLTSNSRYALVEPQVEGTLVLGQRVLLK